MRKSRLSSIAVVSVFAAALIPATAAAYGSASVSGSVKGGAGMNIAALAPNGQIAVRKLSANGRFSLPLHGRGTTLQLIGARGIYFGPVVLRASKGRAYETLSGKTVNLGRVKLRGGYAIALGRLSTRAIDLKRIARANRAGKPIGAGRLGVVKRKSTSSFRGLSLLGRSGAGSASGDKGANSNPGADSDGDGIPNAIDADDNGNGVLDNADPTSKGPSGGGVSAFLKLSFENTVNASAGGASAGQIDSILSGTNAFNLIFYYDTRAFQGRTISGAHVDCFELKYCRRDTGTAIPGGLVGYGADLPQGSRWTDYNPDGSGYPNLEHQTGNGNDVWVMGIQPRVGTSDIHPGDTFNVVLDSDQGPITRPSVLSAYFVTVPAVSSYSSGQTTAAVSYPVQFDSPGTLSNPIAAPTGSLSLKFWRPQRAGIAGVDAGPFVDMGHLHYGLSVGSAGMPAEVGCRGFYSAYDGGIIDGPAQEGDFSLLDPSDDAVPSADRELGFTVDLAGCLRAHGVDPSGRKLYVSLTATDESREGGSDRAMQTFTVQLS